MQHDNGKLPITEPLIIDTQTSDVVLDVVNQSINELLGTSGSS